MSANKAESDLPPEVTPATASSELPQIVQLGDTKFFLPAAQELFDLQAQYKSYLIRESGHAARLDDADVVSCKHVRHAKRLGVSKGSKKLNQILGTFGGALFGAGLSAFVTADISKFTYNGASFVAALCMTAGAALIVWQIAKD